jgi:receptor protein-tyrosine kinase
VILITSSLRGEGKTTVAMNLATSLAQKGDKVVVVDADLRRPSLHKVIRANARYGLSSILAGSALSLEEAILSTSIPNLSMIAAGPIPSHPSELLASQRFGELIAELRKRFDYVVIDSPPALALADANVLARQADGVILISRSGVTTRESLTQTKRLLEGTRANLLGVVVNCTNEQEALYGAYHYYYP